MDTILKLQPQLKILILMVAGLMVIIGFCSQGIRLFTGTIIMALIFPVLLATIQQLPLWFVIAILLVAFVIMLRCMAGKEAWGHFLGAIMYDLFWRFPLRLVGSLFRQISRLFSCSS